MKKLLLLLVIFFGVASVYAQESPVFKWGVFYKTNSLTNKGTASPNSIKTDKNKDLFLFGNFTTNTLTANSSTLATYNYKAADGYSFNTPTALGANYTGTASNLNFYLYKTDVNGDILWQVTSNMGDVNTSHSAMTPTADGGAFLALKVRHTNNNENNNDILLGLVDKNGTVTNVRWTYPNLSAYQGVFVKISKEGLIESTQVIPVDFTPIIVNGSSKNVPDGFQFRDAGITSSGEIYLSGTFVKPITFEKEDGSDITFSPHNADGWNGDTQTSTGDLFLIKLNSNLKMLWDIRTTGTTRYEVISSISVDENDNLYLWGNLTGDGAQTIQLGGFPATPTAKTDAFAAKITSSGTVEWFKHYKALAINGSGGRLKITSISYDNGALLAVGSFTGIMADANDNALMTNTNGTSLQGFVVKLDPSSGNVSAQALLTSGGISEVSSAYFRSNKIHVVGYSYVSGSMLYISYDANLGNPTAAIDLLKGGTTSSWAAAIVDNVLIALGRTNGTPTIYGSSFSDSFSAFSNVFVAYTLPGISTGISDNPKLNEGYTVYGTTGQIVVSGEVNAFVTVYNIYGQSVAKNYVTSGPYTIDLAKGIYIVNGKKVIVY